MEEIRESRAVASNAVAAGEFGILDLIQIASDKSRLLILGPIVVGVLVFAISFIMTPIFTATTKILPPQAQQSAAAAMLQGFGSLVGVPGGQDTNNQYVAMLQSRSVADALDKRFQLMQRYEEETKEDMAAALLDHITVVAGEDNLITITVDDHDPVFAANLANAFVTELDNLLNRLAVTEAQRRRVFFEKHLVQSKNDLIKAERSLQQTGINQGAFKSNPEAAVAAIAQLQAQIAAQEVKVSTLRGYLTEESHGLKNALHELAALKAQLASIGSSSPLKNTKDDDYVSRYRDYKYYETLFELFAKQLELAKLDESKDGALIQVVDVAQTPDKRSKPKSLLLAILATVASELLLLFYVITRVMMHEAVYSDPVKAEKIRHIRQNLTIVHIFGRSLR